MTTIVEFLTARLDEDEAVARACGVGIRDTWHTIEWYDGQFDGRLTVSVDVHGIAGTPITSRGALLRADGVHIARHDPARVLAEVKAKRAIVQAHACVWLVDQWVEVAPGQRRRGELRVCRACEPVSGFMTDQWPCLTVKLMAAPYDRHPDYDPAWRVA